MSDLRQQTEMKRRQRVKLTLYEHVVLPNSSEFWSISADVNTELRSGGEGRRDGHNTGQKRRKNRWKVEFSPVNATVPVCPTRAHTHVHARTLQKSLFWLLKKQKRKELRRLAAALGNCSFITLKNWF